MCLSGWHVMHVAMRTQNGRRVRLRQLGRSRIARRMRRTRSRSSWRRRHFEPKVNDGSVDELDCKNHPLKNDGHMKRHTCHIDRGVDNVLRRDELMRHTGGDHLKIGVYR